MNGRPTLLLFACFTTPAHGQSGGHLDTQRLALPLMDLVVLADSTRGVTLLAASNLNSQQGADRTTIEQLTFHPDSLREWLPEAFVFADSAAAFIQPESKRAIGTRQFAWRNEGQLVLGYDPALHGKDHYLIRIDNAKTGRHWALPVSGKQLRELLQDLQQAATRARLGVAPSDSTALRALAAALVDEPPVMITRPVLRYPPCAGDQRGWVWAEYVVLPDGEADPASLAFVLTDGAPFESAVQAALAEIHFTPGRLAGVAVPVVVFQVFVFGRLAR